MSEKIKALSAAGQSLWYDNIARDLLESGAIQALIDEGILGMTSNPSIFQKAITGSAIYDEQLRGLAEDGKDAKSIYESLAVADIQTAADILLPVYERTSGADGFVSLEVSPLLANDTDGTIAEAARLREWVDRPNLMIKIPATDAGLPAIEEAIFRGFNINVTLIFSNAMYAQVIEAYIKGLERRAEAGESLVGIASVASFFVSRVDAVVDKLVADRDDLQGKAAIANAKLAYKLFQEVFGTDRFKVLADKGAVVQRPLWASTSTKNPTYPDTLYIDSLIGPMTVNTAPPKTIEAFKDHGAVAETLTADVAQARKIWAALAEAGVDMTAVTDDLLDKGVSSFAEAFQQLLDAVEARRAEFAGGVTD